MSKKDVKNESKKKFKAREKPKEKSLGVYASIVERLFLDRYSPGDTEVAFARDALESTAKVLGVKLPSNLGDVIYSVRYRVPMPDAVTATQPPGMEWVIVGRGRGRYAFKLVRFSRIVPNPNLVSVKIPDSTPEIIAAHALSDEQALLAKVRYNRIIDIFLGLAAYSLQNHLRTTVAGTGQIEIDEIYVGVDRQGRQFVMPVQAKGGSDQLAVVQTQQDIDCCTEKFPNLICRPISTQFIADDLLAIFELAVEDDEVKVVEEKHYKLVPARAISADDLLSYRTRS